MAKETNSRRPNKPKTKVVEMEQGRPTIPPGEYSAVCFDVQKCNYYERRSLYVWFRIVDSEFDGTKLFMACNWPPGKIKRSGKLYKQWCLAQGRKPAKGERFAMKRFKGKMYRIRVRITDSKDQTGRRYPDFMQYSVVDTIIEAETGVPKI